LKLWQSHIEALSKPKAKPFLKRYEEAQEFSSMQFEQENKH